MLHLLYDKDVLEDSSILSWMEQEGKDPVLKARIRAKSRAFVDWLQQSDSEEE